MNSCLGEWSRKNGVFFGVVWWLWGCVGGGELSEFQEGFLGGKKREKNNSKQNASKTKTKQNEKEKKMKNTFSVSKKITVF